VGTPRSSEHKKKLLKGINWIIEVVRSLLVDGNSWKDWLLKRS
jgi:hypothetical protein